MMNFTGKGKKDLHLPHTLVLMLITLQQQVSNGVTPLGVCVCVCVCVCWGGGGGGGGSWHPFFTPKTQTRSYFSPSPVPAFNRSKILPL